MANRLRGEVELKAGEKTVVLRLTINEIISLQDEFKVEDVEEFFKALQKNKSLKQVRTIIFHAMKSTDKEATEEAAGDLITEIGIQKIAGVIEECLKWALPEPDPKAKPQRGKAIAASPGARPS